MPARKPKVPCSQQPCPDVAWQHGLCVMHLFRKRRTGDAATPPRKHKPRTRVTQEAAA